MHPVPGLRYLPFTAQKGVGKAGDIFELLTTNRLSGSAEDAVIRALTMKCLQEEFMQLSKRDQDILGRHFGVYGFPKSDLREIAMRNRMKEPGVEKAREQALKHLRDRYRNSFVWKIRRARQHSANAPRVYN